MNPNVEGNLYQYMTKILAYLNERVSVMVDWRIADARRICKVPYSIAVYPDDEVMTIAQPIRDLDSFNLNKVLVRSQESELNLRVREFIFNMNGKIDKLSNLVDKKQEIPIPLEEVKI
jgi:hypothetical protein